MGRRRKTDTLVDSLTVVLRDGTRLRCSVAAIGHEDEPRWTVLDATGAQFLGPVARERSRDAVKRIIQTWWDQRPTTPRQGSD